MENSNLKFAVGQKVKQVKGSDFYSNRVGTIVECQAPGEWAGTKQAGPTGRFRINWGPNKTWMKGDALVLVPSTDGPAALAEAIVDHVAQEEEKDLYPSDHTVVLSLTIQQLEQIELALLSAAASMANQRHLTTADVWTRLAADIAGHNPNR